MGKIIFKPKFSLWGWLVPFLFIGFLWFCIWLKYPTIFIEIDLLKKHGLPLVFFSLLALLEIIILFTIRYELDDEALYLKGGPFIFKIPYSEIKQICKANLVFHPAASNRWPGYAFGDCYYADAGKVTMCSTRMCKGIIIIQTITKLYGVSPKDEEEFIRKLKERMK